mmetsp:Transcript_47557/g.142066  ORF Transcript_47557/g.142066 Transcript_47557/m.142066 type:complete len:205 (-) Transcript_47557:185-799(-)
MTAAFYSPGTPLMLRACPTVQSWASWCFPSAWRRGSSSGSSARPSGSRSPRTPTGCPRRTWTRGSRTWPPGASVRSCLGTWPSGCRCSSAAARPYGTMRSRGTIWTRAARSPAERWLAGMRSISPDCYTSPSTPSTRCSWAARTGVASWWTCTASWRRCSAAAQRRAVGSSGTQTCSGTVAARSPLWTRHRRWSHGGVSSRTVT